MEAKIFISYRREDSIWSAGRIHDRLIKHFPEEKLFIDIDSIAPGDDFITYIEQAVNSCDILLAVIGGKWLEGIQAKSQEIDFVRLEICTALKNKLRVIPILIENTRMPLEKDLPDELKPLARKNAFFINPISFNSEIEILARQLKDFFLQKEKKQKAAEALKLKQSEEKHQQKDREVELENQQRAKLQNDPRLYQGKPKPKDQEQVSIKSKPKENPREIGIPQLHLNLVAKNNRNS